MILPRIVRRTIGNILIHIHTISKALGIKILHVFPNFVVNGIADMLINGSANFEEKRFYNEECRREMFCYYYFLEKTHKFWLMDSGYAY